MSDIYMIDESEIVRPEEQRLIAAARKIGPNALAALTLIAERMARGRELYNEDFDRPRNWRAEAAEELLDATVYLAVESILPRQG